MIKKITLFIAICFPHLVIAQVPFSTFTSDNVISKKNNNEVIYFSVNDTLKPINNAFIIYYKQGCKNQPDLIKEIKDGKLYNNKNFTFYDESCDVNEVYYYKKRSYIKTGVYLKYDKDGKKITDGYYNYKGNRNGLFVYHKYKKNLTIYKKYSDGNRILRFTSKDSISTEAKITKNIISFDLFCLSYQVYKVYYERYLGNHNYLKLEFETKPKSVHHATEFLRPFDTDNPYIEFAHKRYLFAVDYEKLFSKKRHPYYFSIGLYYLNKSYDSLYFYDYHGDGNNPVYLQSEYSFNYGARVLLGRKIFLGNVKHKINEVIDFYVGIGICKADYKKTIYGITGDAYYHPHVTMYPEPEIKKSNELMFSAFVGLRIGVGW